MILFIFIVYGANVGISDKNELIQTCDFRKRLKTSGQYSARYRLSDFFHMCIIRSATAAKYPKIIF